MRYRIQFSLKTMLWLMLVVASFFGGMSVNERLADRRRQKAVRQAQLGLQLRIPLGARLQAQGKLNAALIEGQRNQVTSQDTAIEIQRGLHPNPLTASDGE